MQCGDFWVPDERCGLIIRNGQPAQWLAAGQHALPSGPGQLEVRWLPVAALAAPLPGVRDQFYERGFLFVDGTLVAMVKPARTPGSPISAWDSCPEEGWRPSLLEPERSGPSGFWAFLRKAFHSVLPPQVHARFR